jgi:hypothetical protein
MAIFTFLSVFAFMAVVMFVAAETVGWKFLFLFLVLFQDFRGMTTVARGLCMLSCQTKICFLAVIEPDPVPFFWCMATIAFFTVAAPVYILDLVTAYTCVRGVLVLLVNMTGRA